MANNLITKGTALSGAMTVANDLTVSGDAAVTGTVTATGAVTASSDLTVSGTLTVPGGTVTGPGREYWLNGGASYPTRESIPRWAIASTDGDTAALSTGVMTSVALYLEAGDTVTNLTFVSGGTAAGTPTNWWFALYSPALALLGQTADQTTTAWAANTAQTVALASAYSVTTSGVYYAACMVTATTPPTLAGRTLLNAVESGVIVTGQAKLAVTSGSSLTDTAPATIATPTTVATVPYAAAN